MDQVTGHSNGCVCLRTGLRLKQAPVALEDVRGEDEHEAFAPPHKTLQVVKFKMGLSVQEHVEASSDQLLMQKDCKVLGGEDISNQGSCT